MVKIALKIFYKQQENSANMAKIWDSLTEKVALEIIYKQQLNFSNMAKH